VTGAATMGDAELRSLVQEVVPQGASAPFGAYIFRGEERGAELGRHVEQAVFLEAFGNTPEVLAEQYGRYEPSSIFICVVDHLRRIPAGVMRVLLPSPQGFKSLNDIEPVWGVSATSLAERNGLRLDLDKTWDVATLAIAAEYRGKAARGVVSMGLYQTLTLAARRCGIEWFVAILDMPVFRMIRWRLRMIFAGYEGIAPLPYLGSAASIPAWCDVVAAERHLAANDLDLHAVLVEGVGLESALQPVDLDSADSITAWRRTRASGQ
jgi:hypothetical protein